MSITTQFYVSYSVTLGHTQNDFFMCIYTVFKYPIRHYTITAICTLRMAKIDTQTNNYELSWSDNYKKKYSKIVQEPRVLIIGNSFQYRYQLLLQSNIFKCKTTSLFTFL